MFQLLLLVAAEEPNSVESCVNRPGVYGWHCSGNSLFPRGEENSRVAPEKVFRNLLHGLLEADLDSSGEKLLVDVCTQGTGDPPCLLMW